MLCSARQIFIADDAFGRTEYEPARGRYWEHDLERVLRGLDAQHWLIWTSRKHILERALRDLDLQGRASRFPLPGDVLVDASQLELQEKALILYRHAKATGLARDHVELVRQYAPLIVQHKSFTPERIRRFVSECLPACINALRSRGAVGVSQEIDEAIRNPTDRMRKTFRALSPSHKWVLVGLLECGRWPEEQAVRAAYEAHCPAALRENFSDIVDQLAESFVNRRSVDDGCFLAWVHPSCRDLVIEELSVDPDLCQEFLRTCSPSGLILAISEAGGAAGRRRLPLMIAEESWTILRRRAIELIAEATPETCCEMLTSISDVMESVEEEGVEGEEESRAHLSSLLEVACTTATDKWDRHSVALSGEQLRSYGTASTRLLVLPKMPDLRASWNDAQQRLRGQLQREAHTYVDTVQLDAWSDLVTAIAMMEPRFMAQQKFPGNYEEALEELFDDIEGELSSVNYEGLCLAGRGEDPRLKTAGLVRPCR